MGEDQIIKPDPAQDLPEEYKNLCNSNVQKIQEDRQLEFNAAKLRYFLDGAALVRFFNAREKNSKQAAEMHKAWVEWCLDFKADEISAEKCKKELLKETIVLGDVDK